MIALASDANQSAPPLRGKFVRERILCQTLPDPPRVTTVFGGVSINPQMMALRGGAEVVVATPGRLLDLVEKTALQLRDVTALVLDEADRLLDLGETITVREATRLRRLASEPEADDDSSEQSGDGAAALAPAGSAGAGAGSAAG